MYYKEFLRARGALTVFVAVTAALLVISLVGMWFVPQSAHPDASMAAPPWPGMLGVAALFASILATCLGSTLAFEYDGHLELACTKPCSRARYATTVIAVDMAAIVLAEIVAFVFIMLHYMIGHGIYHYVAGPNTVANTARFLFFPLAWYALIAGLSAGPRVKSGVVQGLIWPVAFVLVVLREVPLGAIWHNFFVLINWINPIVLVSYHDRTDLNIGSTANVDVVASALMLAALTIAGWLAATAQWRRVEA